ncbi:MAG TPA: hypothetical protein VFW73_02105, partial [Lacipirellulaceae bacterium]|nr:hypothetical protein [Lacipirellulaceae bacterium]
KMLLSADPAAAQAIEKLGADFDFQDVNPKDAQQLKECATVASAIKKLMTDLAASSTATIRDRLQLALGRQLSNAEVAALLAGLSPDTLRSAAETWSVGTSTAKNSSQPPTPSHGPQTTVAATRNQRPTAYAPAGTWFRDDASFSIRYRPSAHADPVLTAWLNVLSETPDINQRPLIAAMFKQLSKQTSPGLCASCHSVEQSQSGKLVINWRAYNRTNELRGFTKFSHSPHLVLPELADCIHCHSIDATADSANAYADLNPSHFVSDFSPISKRQCVECHTTKAAGNACQMCHNYHVQTVDAWRNTKPTKLRTANLEMPHALPAPQSAMRNALRTTNTTDSKAPSPRRSPQREKELSSSH